MNRSLELMKEEISSQALLFELCSDDLIKQAKEIAQKHDFVKKINRVYITGCGDSYFAGIACREVFKKYTKIHTEVYQSMEFSRYVCEDEVDDKALVLSVSVSGKVVRTAECAVRAAQKGALSVAITCNQGSMLGKSAAEQIVIDIPDSLAIAPGTRSYAASQYALICLSMALGQEMGTLTKADTQDVLAYIKRIGEAMKKTVEVNFDLVQKYVDVYLDPEHPLCIKMFHILGSGPNWATAQFGTMKLLEAAGVDSIPQGIEEWAHTQYFTTKPGTHVITIAPRGNSRDRAIEVMQAVSVMDGKKIVIAEENDEELARIADVVFPICGIENMKEEFSNFIYSIPLQILAFAISKKGIGTAFEFDKKPWKKHENFRQIWGSKLVELD